MGRTLVAQVLSDTSGRGQEKPSGYTQGHPLFPVSVPNLILIEKGDFCKVMTEEGNGIEDVFPLGILQVLD